jgi:hypothetical protein
MHPGHVLPRHPESVTGKGMRSRQLTLREATAFDRLEDFVRQEEIHGAELSQGFRL